VILISSFFIVLDENISGSRAETDENIQKMFSLFNNKLRNFIGFCVCCCLFTAFYVIRHAQ
jgi:hypothetical protein